MPFSFSDADLALKVERFSERYVKQAVAVMAAQFDADIAAAVSNSFTGTNVDGVTIYADAFFSWDGTTGVVSAPGITGEGLIEYPANSSVMVDV